VPRCIVGAIPRVDAHQHQHTATAAGQYARAAALRLTCSDTSTTRSGHVVIEAAHNRGRPTRPRRAPISLEAIGDGEWSIFVGTVLLARVAKQDYILRERPGTSSRVSPMSPVSRVTDVPGASHTPRHGMQRTVRVGAFQSPLDVTDARVMVSAISEQLAVCESSGVELLCCAEACLGGLGDFAADPRARAVCVDNGELADLLAPMARSSVTCAIGFSELATDGTLFNSAALVRDGQVVGVYRKRRPALRRSVYAPGTLLPVFTHGQVRFGVLICNDSNFPEFVQSLKRDGAQLILIPTNNGLPPQKSDVAAATRSADLAIAASCGLPVVRADVAGRTDALWAIGTSGITHSDGRDVRSEVLFSPTLIVADVIVSS
jgi:5-aminopentanamidase